MLEISPSPAPLGTIAKSAATPINSGVGLTERYRLQSLSRRLLPHERVAQCFRSPRPMYGHLEIYYSPTAHAARFVGLQRCASVWHCPVCAAHISERRRSELSIGIATARSQGLAVFMQTRTVRHHKHNALRPLLDNFSAAGRSLTDGRKGTSYLRQAFGFIGKISSLEVTYGENGWHPHVHELVFLPAEVDPRAYEDYMRARWVEVARRHNLDMNARGYRLDETYGAVEDYVAKYGHASSGTPWGVEAEMTKSHLKRSLSARGETPFSLLGKSEDIPEAAALFREYARHFKGKRQLVWTPGLRELLGVEDISDEQIIEGRESDCWLLALLSWSQWQVILAQDARAEVYAAANTGDVEYFRAVLVSLGVEGVTE